MTNKIALATGVVMAMAGTAGAERVPCVTSTRDGFSFVCSYGESGNASQINTELSVLSDDLEHAMLCGPTAASNALDQLLDRTSSVAGSWIANNFEPKSRKTRIVNVAGAVGWVDGWGTNELGMDWFQNRAHDIDPAFTSHKDFATWSPFASQTLLTDTYFRQHLQQGSAMVLHRTKYDELCTHDWFGNLQCNYTDQTDHHHLMAVNGTLTNNAGLFMTRVWQSHGTGAPSATQTAKEQIRDFAVLPVRGTDDHRPNGAFTVFFNSEISPDTSHNLFTVVTRVHRIETH